MQGLIAAIRSKVSSAWPKCRQCATLRPTTRGMIKRHRLASTQDSDIFFAMPTPNVSRRRAQAAV
eukprot:2840870-Pleurochrysis_carterae.AAC.4